MNEDTRRDKGDFYKGGKRVITTPVEIGGDVRHSDFADVTVNARTLSGLRAAVADLGRKLGATVTPIALIAASAIAYGAGVTTADLNSIDLDGDATVVTAVDFDGLATMNDVATNALKIASATNAVVQVLQGDLSVVAQSATNYTDAATNALPSWAKAATKPSYTLNEVCPSTENWLGVPGTTAAGKSIKVLAKTVDGVIEGGLTVTGSSNNDNNTTKYRYGGVTATRSGIATDYLFDTSSASGVVRRSELGALKSEIVTATNTVETALRCEVSELRSSKVSTSDFQSATNELAAATAAGLALKADLANYATPTLTTDDLWLCNWIGEVLPLRLNGPMYVWQKAQDTKPALIYIRSAGGWQLNPTGSTLLSLPSTAETVATLDFGDGYTLTRLGPETSHVVYSDELASFTPGNYSTVSNRAMTATMPEDVTAAIREQSLGGIWDEALQVWWTPRMRNGSLTYEATTNVNLNAEN